MVLDSNSDSILVLGIESTCDETSISIVENGIKIHSLVIDSQIAEHAPFGGVVPELASRHHVSRILPCLSRALEEASLTLQDIDIIACSEGPGLIGSLLIGIRTAQALAWSFNKPLVGINHIEAHLYAAMMNDPHFPKHLPALGCVLSGGHTSLFIIHEIGRYELIGQTVDDAIGEAFDKVAKMLGLPYPGGPSIEKLALDGNKKGFLLKSGTVKGHPYSFSFSGLKTAVLYTLNKKVEWTSEEKASLAASFQDIALMDVIKKIQRASEEFNLCRVYFGGGVTHNKELRRLAATELNVTSIFPKEALSTDNGAMIAGLGYHVWKRENETRTLTLAPKTRIEAFSKSVKHGTIFSTLNHSF